jgi:hypothetical protein
MNGVFVGIIFSVITGLTYLLDINMFSISYWIIMLIVNMTIIILAIIYTIKNIRKKVPDQTLNYLSRFLSGLIVGVIAGWVSGLFSYLLFNVIDPNYMLNQVENFADTLFNYGMSEDDVYETIDKMKESLQPVEQLKSNLLKMPAFYIVLSLIISAFIKSKENENTETVY